MLDHFPNLYIGITGAFPLILTPFIYRSLSHKGVITYSSNLNTANVVRNLASTPSSHLRILLETDAPFMVPSNVYETALKGVKRLPLSHSGMIPWTAEFVASVANEARQASGAEGEWDADKVMCIARENARTVYGI